jgi:hypothetical protein
MSIDDTDVLARLRAGADTVEEHRFDTHEVLAGSRRALRRRRSWQAVGACTTAAAVAFSLALAGPVPVPGLGDVTLPGSEQVREVLGLVDADTTRCEVPEPTVPRSPVESGTNVRPGVTYDLAQARPMSTCFDVRIDGRVIRTGFDPTTLTEDGTFWRTPSAGDDSGGTQVLRQVDPLNAGAGDAPAAPVVTASDEGVPEINGLATQGSQAAWFETVRPGDDQPPSQVILAAGGERTDSVTGEHTKSRSITEIESDYGGDLAVTARRVAWREEVSLAGTADRPLETMTAWAAPLESGDPEILAEQATAVGGDNDEIVVATLDQLAGDVWTTTFTSFGDDGTQTDVLTLEHPSETYVPLVDITDDVLAYALDRGYHLAVVPRVNGIADPDNAQAVAVRLGHTWVDVLRAEGDAVTWVSGPDAYLLRGAGTADNARPDLMRVIEGGLRKRVMVGLAGNRIAWATPAVDATGGEVGGTEVRVSVGTLLVPEGPASDSSTVQGGAGSDGRTVPAAPTVTVPENAVFRTYD